jgi:hypothetical protein
LGEALAPLEALVAQLAMLLITVLFPLLASDLSLAELSPLGLGGVVSAAVPHCLIQPNTFSIPRRALIDLA